MPIKEKLLQYEKSLFDVAFCRRRETLAERISEECVEFGASGRVFGKREIVEALHGLQESRDIAIYRFQVAPIAAQAYLVRYIAWEAEKKQYSLRSSVWREETGHLRLLFHQGTPAGEFLPGEIK